MANNLRVFNTNSEYQSADLVHPAVSYVIETDKVIYEPTTPTPSFKWKATYSDSHTESAECDSSSAITKNEINLTNLVSVEIGECVRSIGFDVFWGCTSLTSCTIGSGVTDIGSFAFYSCTSLTSVTIGSGVTSIDGSAFRDCTSLTSITIPSGVTSIGNSAFAGCRSLTSIEIPSGVTFIGFGAFNDCTSLTSITVNATTPPSLATNSVFDNTNNSPILVPSQSVEAYKSATNWSQYASRIFPIP